MKMAKPSVLFDPHFRWWEKVLLYAGAGSAIFTALMGVRW
jgi:hypothetical protein